MAAANFSRDVLENFSGLIPNEENQRLDFEIVRNNLILASCVENEGSRRQPSVLKFFQKTKNRFIDVCSNEVQALRSVKVQFGLNVIFYIDRDGDGEVDRMTHYFNRMQPIVLNEHNIDTLNHMLNQFVDEVRGEIQDWSGRGSGWVVDEILDAYINIAQYQPLNGGSYMLLPETLKNKTAVLNIKNRDNMCLRWAIHAALFPTPRGLNPQRPSSYPTIDGLNFEGIDFPTLVSQIDKLERQNPNLAINVFGWEKEQVIVHRISEQDGNIPRIKLMITKKGDNTHYTYVKRLMALLYDQSKNSNSKHFCERCLHGYSRKDLLERHNPECKGLLKNPIKTEMLKEGEHKMSFRNHYKQMKVSYVVYADFECVLGKIDGCEPSLDASFTVKTEKHEPCGFSYIAIRSDGKLFGPFTHRGKDAIYVFLSWLQNHEREMREDVANKRPQVMTPEDWKNHRKVTDCHICNKSLVKDSFLDSISVQDPDTGKYSGQSHRRCCFTAMKSFTGPERERQPKDAIDQWIENAQETCLFCAELLLVANFKDSVKDHDHMTGRYRGAAHNECKFKLKLNTKTSPIP